MMLLVLLLIACMLLYLANMPLIDGFTDRPVDMTCPLKVLSKTKTRKQWKLVIQFHDQDAPESPKYFKTESQLDEFWTFLVKNNLKLERCAGMDINKAIELVKSNNPQQQFALTERFQYTLSMMKLLNYFIQQKARRGKVKHEAVGLRALKELKYIFIGFKTQHFVDTFNSMTEHDLAVFDQSYLKWIRSIDPKFKQISNNNLLQLIDPNVEQMDKLLAASSKTDAMNHIKKAIYKVHKELKGIISNNIDNEQPDIVTGAPGQIPMIKSIDKQANSLVQPSVKSSNKSSNKPSNKKLSNKPSNKLSNKPSNRQINTQDKRLTQLLKDNQHDRERVFKMLKQSKREDRDMLNELNAKIIDNGRKLQHQQHQIKLLKQSRSSNIQHDQRGLHEPDGSLRDNIVDNPAQEKGVLGEMLSRGRPPLCIPQKHCPICPTQSTSGGLNANSAANLTKVGSILPKFKYHKIYDAKHY